MNNLFKWRHFNQLIILQCMRWYLRYPLSYRQLEELMLERGVEVDHTTVYRWIQKYAPEFEKRLRWYSKKLGLRWRVDETFIKVKGQWKYLYRAVDEHGDTIDFMLAHKRDIKTAKRFFKKALRHTSDSPYEINTDRLAIYKPAINSLKEEDILPKSLIHTQDKLMNNVIESDHRRIKRRVRPMLWFKSFHTAQRCIKGLEAM